MVQNVLCAFAVLMAFSLQSPRAQENGKCMEGLKAQAKLSCKLTTPELQQRKKKVIAELKNLLLEKVETVNGFRYKFDASDQMLDKLNEFIKTERMCCDFFTFTLTVSGDAGVVWLEIAGTAEAKQFIKDEIDFLEHCPQMHCTTERGGGTEDRGANA